MSLLPSARGLGSPAALSRRFHSGVPGAPATVSTGGRGHAFLQVPVREQRRHSQKPPADFPVTRKPSLPGTDPVKKENKIGVNGCWEDKRASTTEGNGQNPRGAPTFSGSSRTVWDTGHEPGHLPSRTLWSPGRPVPARRLLPLSSLISRASLAPRTPVTGKGGNTEHQQGSTAHLPSRPCEL